MKRWREPFLKGVILHNPVSCERESSMLTQVAPERGRQTKAVRCTVRFWVCCEADQTTELKGTRKGTRRRSDLRPTV